MDPKLIEHFLSAQDVRQTSKQSYCVGLKLFFNWLAAQSITEPTKSDVLAYRNSLLDAGLSTLTINSYLTSIRQFFSWMSINHGTDNVGAGVKGPRPAKGFRKDALTTEQAAQLLATFDTKKIEGLRNFAIVNLMLRTGLRCIEVIWADVGDIEVSQGETILWVWGKGSDHKDEFVVMTPSATAPVEDYLRHRTSNQKQDPLFVSHSRRNEGGRLTTQTVRSVTKAGLRAIGIDSRRYSAHSLRHTGITFSLKAGATLQEAQAMARHSNISTTLLYSHNINRLEHSAERKIDDYFQSPKT